MSKLKVKVRIVSPKANTLAVNASGLKGNYIAGTGIGITGNSIAVTSGTVKSKSMEAHWSNDTLTANESAKIHTNHGATSDITLTLPASPAAGTWFIFSVMTEPDAYLYELRIDPGAATIYAMGEIETGKYIWSKYSTQQIMLVANSAGNWVQIGGFSGRYGNWQFEV